jgi:uncharacterized protein YdeI (YjbR/CyaY-like superfamily)
MKALELVHATTREEWRAWLARHHASATEIWLVFHKKHTGKPRVPYEDAVEEALCFGWIDSLVRRLDDERYAQKFTPRKAGSTWSESNRRRFAKLVREGRMTAAGLALSPPAGGEDAGGPSAPRPKPKASDAVPGYIEVALRAHGAAWTNFTGLAPSHRRHYTHWIETAKRQETRLKRLAEAISLLAENKKLGLK